MDIEKLNYNLPAELIAQKPAEKRDAGKLLVLDRKAGSIADAAFNRIADYLNKGDCLVINNTKVLPAKFFAHRKSRQHSKASATECGAKIEGLFLRSSRTIGW